MSNLDFLINPYKKTADIKFIPCETKSGEIKYTADQNIGVYPNDSFPEDEMFLNDVPLKFYFDGEAIIYEKPIDVLEGQVKINWEKRLKNMQNSLALSILKKVVAKNYREDIISSSIKDKNYIEIAAKDIAYSYVHEVEEYMNYLIHANLLVNKLNLREGRMNYFAEINGPGKFQVAGPLLSRTGELGLFKITKVWKNNSGNIVMEFITGTEALSDYLEKFEIIENLKTLYEVNSAKDVLSASKNIKYRFESLQRENKKMEKELNLETVNELTKKSFKFNDYNIIYKIINSPNFKELKFTSQKIMDMEDFIQVYGMPNGPTSSFLIVRSKNMNFLNLTNIMKEVSKKYKVEGSGNIMQVQGNVPTMSLVKTLEAFIAMIKEEITKQNKN